MIDAGRDETGIGVGGAGVFQFFVSNHICDLLFFLARAQGGLGYGLSQRGDGFSHLVPGRQGRRFDTPGHDNLRRESPSREASRPRHAVISWMVHE